MLHAWARGGTLHEHITRAIIGAFFELHRELGYGFLESVYSAGMQQLLRERGLKVAREVMVPVYLRGRAIAGQRIDMLVEDCVVVENKSTLKLAQATFRQLLSYLTSTRLEVGLILHFGEEPKFHRVISSNE